MATVEQGPDGRRTITVDAAAAERLHEAAERARGGAPVFGEAAPQAEGYQLSEEVRTVGERILAAEPRFAACQAVAIGWALQVGKRPEGKGGLHLLAKAVKAPTLWRDLGEYEVVIWANAMAWGHLTERQREALLTHELCHVGGHNDSGNVVMLEHDIEEFAWVVGKYGQWHSGLEVFAEQLGLGLQR